MSSADRSVTRLKFMDFVASYETIVEATDFRAPSCITFTNFQILDPEAAHRHLTQLYIEANHSLNPIILGKLKPGTMLVVAGGEDFIPLSDNCVLSDQMPHYWAEDEISGIFAAPRPTVQISGSAVLIGRYGHRTWGHWLGELLPKMVCVEHRFPGKYRYVMPESIFHDDVLRPILESIWYHGIDLSRILPAKPDTIYQFSELLAVSSAWTNHKIHPGAVEIMQKKIKPSKEALPNKVAFLRTESRTRNVANAQAVIDQLGKSGFSMVEIGGLSFSQQVATFAAARTVATVLGSGLTGVIYSPLGVNVLTLAPARWSDLFFFALMQTRNAQLADIRGPQDCSDPRSPSDARFYVDLTDIEKGLQSFR